MELAYDIFGITMIGIFMNTGAGDNMVESSGAGMTKNQEVWLQCTIKSDPLTIQI